MTREEAIKELEELKAAYDIPAKSAKNETFRIEFENAAKSIDIALAALRGPTREQVRAIKREWEKVDHLDYGELAFDTLRCGECEYEENIDPEEKHPNFCPNCGSPMTKKGVLILCNRLEALKDD